MERCLKTGKAVAWFEPGEDCLMPGVNQVIPLPQNGGLVASFTPMPEEHPPLDPESKDRD